MSTKQSLETAIIGTLLRYPKLYITNESTITPDKFNEVYQNIVSYIIDEFGQGKKLSMARMAAEINYPYAKLQSIESHSDVSNFEGNLEEFIDLYQKEMFLNLMNEARYTLEENSKSAGTAYSELTATMNDVVLNRTQAKDYHIGASLLESTDRILEARNVDGLTGVSTGIPKMNSATGGYRPGQQIIIAGRAGMGKTTWLMFQIMVACMSDQCGVLFNLEMTKHEVNLIFLSMVSGIHLKRLRSGGLTATETQKLLDASGEIKKWKLFVYDSVVDIDKLIMQARILNRQHDLSFVAIDYLQLLGSGKYGNRQEIVADMSRKLKMMTKPEDVNCYNLILSQLSRSVDSRNDKRPLLSDLRESGAIEQDADQVQFVYRPRYYGEGEFDLTEIIVAKDRGGDGVRHIIKVELVKNGFIPFSELTAKPVLKESKEVNPLDDLPF